MVILAAIGEERPPNDIVTVVDDLASVYGDRLVVLHVIPEEEFEDH